MENTTPKPAPDINARLDNLSHEQWLAMLEVGAAEAHSTGCEQGRVKAAVDTIASIVGTRKPADVNVSKHKTQLAAQLRRLGLDLSDRRTGQVTAEFALIHLRKRRALTQASVLVWSMAIERVAAIGHKKGWLDAEGRVL